MDRSPRKRASAGRVFARAPLLLAAALVGCASGPPELSLVEWTVSERPSDGGRAERSLSVFARVADPDGIEDVEALWIVHDAAELVWTLDSSTWARRDVGDEAWIGSPDLVLPDGSSPPSGIWRVIAADFAGNRAERSFRLDEGASRTLPVLSVREGTFSLESSWPEAYLVAYDGAGTAIRNAIVTSRSGRLETALGSVDLARTQAVAAFGYDPSTRRGGWSPRMRTK